MKQSQVRIIGGQWKRSKLAFTPSAGLRPTPDRVKETVFSWLLGQLQQARCLDLFAGSGSLGLEALSRGAAQVDFVDIERENISKIQGFLGKVGASAGRYSVVVSDALQFLHTAQSRYNLVFLDPPYASELLADSLVQLRDGEILAEQGLVYVEHARGASLGTLRQDWQVLQHKTAGQVEFYLLTKP